MPIAGYEAAIRLCATNGQWQKAVSVVREVRTSQEVSGDTLGDVFSALARERQGRTALDLLQVGCSSHLVYPFRRCRGDACDETHPSLICTWKGGGSRACVARIVLFIPFISRLVPLS
jgi:hypothetical protein